MNILRSVLSPSSSEPRPSVSMMRQSLPPSLTNCGPHPESLGAGIDGVAHTEAIAPAEKNSVEDVAFAGSVLACDCDDMDVACGEGGQEGEGLLGEEGVCMYKDELLSESKATSWTACIGRYSPI